MNDFGSELAQLVLTGPVLVGVPIALLAGVVSFVSPCVLPLVPGYLAYVAGMVGQDQSSRSTSRVVWGAVLFVLGFTVVFVAFGVLVGTAGSLLVQYSDVLMRVMGCAVIVFGVLMWSGRPALPGGMQLRWRPQTGLLGAPLLGVVFGLGWAPCTSPVLAVVYTLGLTSGSSGQAVALAVAYCVGLGVPFVVVAFGVDRGARSLSWFRRHRVLLGRVGAVSMVVVGLLLVTGVWQSLVDVIRVLASNFETVI